jgi:hypothetical protein
MISFMHTLLSLNQRNHGRYVGGYVQNDQKEK